jgi:hypothetical protein
VHDSKPGSVNQAISGAAVGAGGGTGFLNGQINPGVRIPQFLLGRRAGKGQVSPSDFVFSFRVGAFQSGISGIGGMGHNAVSLVNSVDDSKSIMRVFYGTWRKQCQ